MLRDSTVVVVVVRTRPRAIPLAMIHMRKSIHGFPFVPLYGYGAPLGGLRPPSSAMTVKQSGSFKQMTVQTLKAMLHEAIFLAQHPILYLQLLRCELQEQ